MVTLLISSALLFGAGVLLAVRFTAGGMGQILLGAYVISLVELVLISLLLSTFSAFSRTPLIISLVLIFGIATLVARGQIERPSTRNLMQSLADLFRDPVTLVLAIAVIAVVGYSIALALGLPPNQQDALDYHLARAAFWRQHGAIGYITGAQDERLNAFPPNGEIAMAFTMVASRSGRFAPLVQLLAALATAVAIREIALRVGFSAREGLFGALMFLLLPVVALQMSTGLNDVIVASLVASSCFFLLIPGLAGLSLAGASIWLLIGTKLTGLIAVPGLALVAATGRSQRPRLALLVCAGSTLLGCYWYLVNFLKTGNPFGGVAGQRVHADVLAAAARVIRLTLDAVELPGAIGRDKLLYLAAAVVLAIAAALTRGSTAVRLRRTLLTATVTLLPIALLPLDRVLVHGSQKVFYELGRPDVGYLDSGRSLTKASPVFSWYGPVGLLLLLGSSVLAVRAIRRHDQPKVLIVLAAAPFLWILLIGVAVPYFEWSGRFVMGGFALAAATWGVALRVRLAAWISVALALLAVFLAFVHQHDRPSGLRLLQPIAERSVWSQPDWAVEATDHPHLRALLRFADRNIPATARLALQPLDSSGPNPRGDLPPFPFFGPNLSRTILLTDSAERALREGADWAILREQTKQSCFGGWDAAFRYDVWIVFRRIADSGCR